MQKLTFICLIATFIVIGCAPSVHYPRVAVAFYNCENFFDTVHNPAKEDEEFTPAGKYHYSRKIYEQKVHNIAGVIQSIGGDEGLAIAGLAEVENNTVLDDLIRQPGIVRRGYKYVWFDGPDKRGINVAMLYNPKYFRVIKAEAIPIVLDSMPGIKKEDKTKTRDVLHVYGILITDTIHVFVNHWPSRVGGDEESRPKRVFAAQVDKGAIDSLMKQNPAAKVIVMGDFNDNPTDSSIKSILCAKGEMGETGLQGLYNPFVRIYNSGIGTEEYAGSWNLFDQIIISGALLKSDRKTLYYDSAGVYKPDFLIDTHKGHEGEPCRSWLGSYWLNGYSDHFPVILYFDKKW